MFNFSLSHLGPRLFWRGEVRHSLRRTFRNFTYSHCQCYCWCLAGWYFYSYIVEYSWCNYL